MTKLTPDATIRPVERVSVFNEVMERLLSHILAEGLRPGDRLPPERELAGLLDVGRSSLREAARALSAMGVITITRRGMVVGEGESALLTRPLAWGLLLGSQSAREVIEARSVVEASLAESAAERAEPEDLARLRAELQRMEASITSPDEFVVHDLAFHLAVARAGHNVVLLHVVRTIQFVIRAWIEKVIREYEVVPASYHEHRRVYEAIVGRDSVAARAAMADHLMAAGARLLLTITEADFAASADAPSIVGGDRFLSEVVGDLVGRR